MLKQKAIFILFVFCLSVFFLLPMSNSQSNDTQSEKNIKNKDIELIWPLKGWISSKFGPRISPFTNEKEFHEGLDISVHIGTPIHAAASGTVEKVGSEEIRGKAVTLLHNGGYKTFYDKCDEILVQEGQHVESGDVIAKSGNSGRSTGPHLHFEVRKDDKAIDPLMYLDDIEITRQ